MQLSTKIRYGTRLMVDIAANCTQGYVLLGDIAKRQRISEKYLWNLAAPLKAAGFITAQRGVKGGYTMARDPRTITVHDIVQVLEGPVVLVDCRDCGNQGCVTTPVWEQASGAVVQVLSSFILSDLAEQERRMRGNNGAKTVAIFGV